jgi:hypothetical protein
VGLFASRAKIPLDVTVFGLVGIGRFAASRQCSQREYSIILVYPIVHKSTCLQAAER